MANLTDCEEILLLKSYSRSCREIQIQGGLPAQQQQQQRPSEGNSATNGRILWTDGVVEQFSSEVVVNRETVVVQKIALTDKYYLSNKRRSNSNTNNSNNSSNNNENTLNKFYQVPWVVDDCIPDCMLCNAPFTFLSLLFGTNRRHHCRGCGRGVCDSCSQGRIRIKCVNWFYTRAHPYCLYLF